MVSFKNIERKFVGKLLGVIAAIALGFSLSGVQAAITPPATAYLNGAGGYLSANLGFVNKPVIADSYSTVVRVGQYSTCSLQLATVVGTSNATTIKVQGSNTQSAWDDYVFNVITGTTTNQSVLYGFNAPTVEYLRVFVDVTNASPVTVTTGLFCK